MDFNIIDIIVGIFLIYGAYQGFNKGLIYQLSSLLGLIIGIYGTLHFSDYVADYLLQENLMDSKYIKITALFITFIGILVAVHFLGKAVQSIFSLTGLGILNTVGGILFSLIKQLIIISLFTMFILFLNSKMEFINPLLFDESVLYQKAIIPIIDIIKETARNVFH
ncbi:MAG: CvpA family protein [Flavobacteriales bacterium]